MSRARVLIVDDDASIREALARILDYEDYDVRAAASGAEALEIRSEELV